MSPAPLIAILAFGALYWRAWRTLTIRGFTTPRGQIAAFVAGLACWALALSGPVGSLSDKLFTAHMAEHILLAEIGAPLILLAIRSPVLVFLLPRPALVALARRRRLRSALRFVRQPQVAVLIYAVVLYGWHFRFAFEGALRSEVWHAVQHGSFIVISLLVWWPALDPKRRRTPGGLWKVLHILAARTLSMFLAVGFVALPTAAYVGYYADRGREYGLSALTDQRMGAAVMLVVDTVIILFALTFFFWRSARNWDEERSTDEKLGLAAADR